MEAEAPLPEMGPAREMVPVLETLAPIAFVAVCVTLPRVALDTDKS